MIIELFNETHREAVIDVFIDVFNSPPWNDKWTTESACEYLARIMHDKYFMGLCAVEGREVKGFLLGVYGYWYTGQTYHIKELCVLKDCQRNGLAHR